MADKAKKEKPRDETATIKVQAIRRGYHDLALREIGAKFLLRPVLMS
jgi:hypothetical protein